MITLFFGDSLTLGCGDETALGWPGRIAAVLMGKSRDLTWYNLGVRANTTTKLRARWRDEAERRFLPGQDVRLVFSFGVADVANDVSPEDSFANAEAILGEAKALAPTLFIGPKPVGDPARTARIAHLSEEFETLCARLAVPCVPVLGALRQADGYAAALAANDNVHPAAAGYALLADLLLQTETVRSFFGLE